MDRLRSKYIGGSRVERGMYWGGYQVEIPFFSAKDVSGLIVVSNNRQIIMEYTDQ